MSFEIARKSSPKKAQVYLDNAASTKLNKAVFLAMKPYLEGEYANPSSLHSQGIKSKQAISNARLKIASILGVSEKEIIFTSGGTESVNLAIMGTTKAYQTKFGTTGHMIISKIEHEAVLECAQALRKIGWKIDYLSVDKTGVVNLDELKKKVKPNTALVSVMYANNEIGTIQPLTEIGKIISGINKVRNKKNLNPIYFHSDACQAGGLLELNISKLKVDLLTLNGSKICGPKGSGILYVRSGLLIEPIIYGGGQEQGLRSGTENTPAIIGFATALELSQKNKITEIKKLLSLQNYLENKLTKNPLTQINGPRNSKATNALLKLPGTINFSVKGIEAEALMYYLDAKGFAVATGSACTSSSGEPSHVLLAIGLDKKLAQASIRLSLSSDLSISDLNRFILALEDSVKILKNTTQDL